MQLHVTESGSVSFQRVCVALGALYWEVPLYRELSVSPSSSLPHLRENTAHMSTSSRQLHADNSPCWSPGFLFLLQALDLPAPHPTPNLGYFWR